MREAAPAKPKRKKAPLQRPPGLTVDEVIEALRLSFGVQASAARRLKVTRSAVSHFISRHPEVQDAIEEIKEGLIDVAEGKLLVALNAGEMGAIRYFLDNHGAARGYGKKVTVKGDPEHPLHTQAARPDLADLVRSGKMTREELRQMRELQAKIRGAGDGATDA